MAASSPRSLTLVNLTTGLSDGLMLPFLVCVVASSLFPHDTWQQVGTGIAVAALGALVFGLARARGERQEIQHNHPGLAAKEAEQEASLMNAIGIDPVLTGDMQQQMEKERQLWLTEVSEHEMGWDAYDPARAIRSGVETGIGFLAGGVLVSVIFCLASRQSWPLGWITAAVLLFVSGWCKGKLIGKNALYLGLLQLSTGSLAALAVLAAVKLIGPGAR